MVVVLFSDPPLRCVQFMTDVSRAVVFWWNGTMSGEWMVSPWTHEAMPGKHCGARHTDQWQTGGNFGEKIFQRFSQEYFRSPMAASILNRAVGRVIFWAIRFWCGTDSSSGCRTLSSPSAYPINLPESDILFSLSLSLFWPVYSVMLLVSCSSICCDCFSRDEDGAPGSLWMRHLETLGLFLPHSLKARLCPVCTFVHLRPILLRVDFSVTSVVRQVCKLWGSRLL